MVPVLAAGSSTAVWAVATLFVGALLSVAFQNLAERVSKEKRARREASRYDALDLSGSWCAIWQTRIGGVDSYHRDPVQIEQHRNLLVAHNKSVADDLVGGWLWKGELRIYDNQHLLGWYVGNQPNVISKGVFYFVIHNQGDVLEGGWTGCSYDSDLVSGCAVMARTAERAEASMNQLKRDYRASRIRKGR